MSARSGTRMALAYGTIRGMASTRTKPRRHFGSLRTTSAGRIQARFVCPVEQGGCGRMHPGPTTFDTVGDAETYLAKVRADISREVFVCPTAKQAAEQARKAAQRTFREYAEPWLAARRKRNQAELTPRTRRLYRAQLDELLETFGDLPLERITQDHVRQWWHHDLPARFPARPSGNADVYALLRTIMGNAADDGLIVSSPCSIKGAGSKSRQREIRPASAGELTAIAAACPERFQMTVLLAGWCALRFGEVAELRRRDVMDGGAKLAIRRAVTHRDGVTWVGAPKANSVRDVAVPPHLRDALVAHVEKFAQPGPDGLLFHPETRRRKGCNCGYRACVGGHLLSSTAFRWYGPARAAAGRPDLRFHDLRHTGLTLAALAGADLAVLMQRAGHRSVSAAQVYMHAAQGRDDEIAEAMSAMLAAPPKKPKKKAARKRAS